MFGHKKYCFAMHAAATVIGLGGEHAGDKKERREGKQGRERWKERNTNKCKKKDRRQGYLSKLEILILFSASIRAH